MTSEQEEILKILQQQQAEQQRKQIEFGKLIMQARARAIERQQDMDTMPRRKYAVIVAVDERGGFAKDGAIPWNYPEDLKWFKKRTTGHICIMGKKTYEDTNARTSKTGAVVEDAAGESTPATNPSILPDRNCFVCSSTATELAGATVIKDLAGFELHTTEEDDAKTAFIIGGERLFLEGISLADTVYLTMINKDYNCDKFFPVNYLQQYFFIEKVLQNEKSPELRWLIWKRK